MQQSHAKILPQHDPYHILKGLFDEAKAKDEFEFCCAIMRVKGLQSSGWDSLIESQALLNQALAFVESPIDQGFRLRLLLMSYCHATEMFDFYSVIGNMIRIKMGERYTLDCFSKENHQSNERAGRPHQKAARIKEWSNTAQLPAVGELMNDLLIKEVRNAFYHSSYALTKDSFNITSGDGVLIERTIDRSVKYDWLLPRLELGINTALALLQILGESFKSYKTNKVVKGRLQGDGQLVDVELTTDPNGGLTGFKSPPSAQGQT